MNDKLFKSARVTRLAKIFCNISVFCGAILLLLGLMPVMRFFYYIVALTIAAVILVFFLLSLLLFHPFDVQFLNNLFNGDAVFKQIQAFSVKIAPFFCAAAIVFGVISILLILRNKNIPHKGRIVAASVGIALAVIGTVALYLGVYL